MTREQLKRLILWVRFKYMLVWLWWHGVDVKNFDHRSRKTLVQLFEETVGKDVRLVFDKKRKRVVRVAMTATVLIIILSERLKLLEIRRKFQNGDIVEKTKEWSVSETCKIGEEITDAAIRGLQEELGLIVERDQLQLIVPKNGHEFQTYESEAYGRLILSSTMLQRHVLYLPERILPVEFIAHRDSGTEITLRYFPY